MANAKKCDRCGKYYDAYNETNGVASMKGSKIIKLHDLCLECNSEFKKWIGEEEESIYLVTDIYFDDFLSVFKIMISDTSAVNWHNSDFQSCAEKHIKCAPQIVSSKGDFFILDVVYSIKDNVIKLCTFNDRECAKPLSLDDILTAIRCYPNNAAMVVSID